MNSDPKQNQNPSPRGAEDEEAVSESAEEKPIVKKAPQTPDANPIDPRVGNR